MFVLFEMLPFLFFFQSRYVCVLLLILGMEKTEVHKGKET